MDLIAEYLAHNGPSRSADIVLWLIQEKGISSEAARKRISRAKVPVRKFPIPLLPKGESFLYLQNQRESERMWTRFHQAMRASGSSFGIAIDGLLARQGVVSEQEFCVISGATTTPLKGQLTASSVADRLEAAGVIKRPFVADGIRHIEILRAELGSPNYHGFENRRLAEGIVLEGLRQWVRKIGLASYNSIRIRLEPELKPVGPFSFDLAGPSYLQPLKGGSKQPGFFVADVFVDKTLDQFACQYFIKKTSMLNATMNGQGVLAMLVAEGFTGEALTNGHAAGILMATPRDLFGVRAARALQTLLETLNNAAAYAATSPDRLVNLINDLSEIEGAAGNLRGVLFELLAAYLARRSAVSIDMGVVARDIDSGKSADIDILKITHQASDCTAIECKGKMPGGKVELEEVERWLRKIPVFVSHLRNHSQLREANLSFELWTSGDFTDDAIARLTLEKSKRTKHPIGWKTGLDVLAMAHAGKEKAIANALREHFLEHPFVKMARTGDIVEAEQFLPHLLTASKQTE